MMSGIRSKNTKPELIVRRYLHGRGLRYRLHNRSLPGRPDLVLARHRAVVDVRGCFWHRHPGCRFAVMPGSNRQFWSEKLNGNVERDERNEAALSALGWRVKVIWECQVRDIPVLDALYREIVQEPHE